MENNQHQEQLRVFRNPILEALTKTSPLTTLLVYVPVIFFLLYLNFTSGAGIKTSVAIFISGIFFWTFLEYVLHRYLFHFVSESKTAQRIHYVLHGVHHHFPRNKEKLFMPPVPGLTLVGLLYLGFSYLMGDYVLAFLPGIVAGYLIYVFLHYAIHTIRPPKAMEKLWSHHFMHHHRFPEKCFGVSSPFWDYIFGTMPPKKKAKKNIH
jgi:sterol desaturase/sphingolipid hydroxylase (fatty acid hydroxylase superfamily)